MPGPSRPRHPERQRARHSLDNILDTAIELLDEQGDQALTFRALAARLGGGVGSIYWYVSGREELVERATDRILADVVQAADKLAPDRDPYDAIRDLALLLHTTLAAHPWMADYLMRHPELQLNGLRIYDRFGRQTMRLNLTKRQRFLAVDTLVSYINGFDAEARERQREVEEAAAEGVQLDPTELWRSLPAEEYPFLMHVLDTVMVTGEDAQFEAGLDTILSGLRQQAGE